MVRPWRAGHYGRMFLLLLAALGCLGLLFVLALRYSEAVNAALGAVPDWLRRRAWGVLLVPLALLYALISANGYVGAAEVVVAIAFVVFAPRAAAAAVPFATLGLGCWGLALFNRYRQGFPVLTRYGLVPPQFSGPAWYLLLQAVVFLACGLWLLVKVKAPGSGPVTRAASWLWHPHGGVPQWAGLLLLPVLAVAAELLGLHHWFGFRWVTPGLAIAVFGAVLAAAVVLILRSRIWAATLAAAGLVAWGSTESSSPRTGPAYPEPLTGSRRSLIRAAPWPAVACRDACCSRPGCGSRRSSCASTCTDPTPIWRPGLSS